MQNWFISMDGKRHPAQQLHRERTISHANALSPSVSYKWSRNSILQSCLDACNCVRNTAEIHTKPSHLPPEKRVGFKKEDPKPPLSAAAPGRCTILVLNHIISKWGHINLKEHFKTEQFPSNYS